jgi:hypothetical protein
MGEIKDFSAGAWEYWNVGVLEYWSIGEPDFS